MKFLAVFVAILALASANQWTIHELSEALQNPNTDPAMIPHLEAALNQMMEVIWAGGQIDAISVGSPVAVQPVGNQWTIHELSEALQNPNTDPAMIPFLEEALNQMMEIIWAGGQIDAISVGSPIAVNPISVTDPISPTPVVAEPESVVPLVQIIVNVNKQQQQEAQPAVIPRPEPVPVVVPIVPGPVTLPLPVAPEVVLPEPVVLPLPVAPEVVLPEPVVLPAPVAPEIAVNPIDVIAITAPIVNPVDLINPVPVVAPAPAVEAVGPIV